MSARKGINPLHSETFRKPEGPRQDHWEPGVHEPCPRAPSIYIVPTLGPKVYKR